MDESLEYIEGNVNAGMPPVEQVIAALNVLDINVIGVAPAWWPGFIVSEPIATAQEAVIPVVHPGTAHTEEVAITKMGPVPVVGNAPIMVAIVPVAMEAVVAAVVGRALSLRAAALPLLSVLVLRLPSSSSASALFPLSFIGEGRKGGSKKQKENCYADKSVSFHMRCLPHNSSHRRLPRGSGWQRETL
jgi:hypothetical protein